MLTKAQLKTRQRPGNPLKVQVWATGILHTAGYQGEKALTMRGGKKVLLTPADIIRELHAVAVAFFEKGGIELTEREIAGLKESKEHIRSVLSELEDDGIALRTDAAGRKLSELSPEELRRLPSGKTIMYFWLKPRDVKEDIVAEEWSRYQRSLREEAEVAKNLPPEISINHILKLFEFGKLSKKQISDPQAKAAFVVAFDAAKHAFRQSFEVAIQSLPEVAGKSLPIEVAPPAPPEVALPAGALERKVEDIENHHQQTAPAEDADLMMMTFERFHFDVCEAFHSSGKPTPGEKLTKPIWKALKADCAGFIQYLTPAKLKPVQSAGILPDLLQNFRDAQKVAAKRPPKSNVVFGSSEAPREMSSYIEEAKLIMEHPEKFTEADIEFAQEILRQQAAGDHAA